MPTKSRLVWTSETGRVREHAGRGSDAPSPHVVQAPRELTACLSRERKGRAGKTVTLVEGLALPPDELEALARELRRACGAGGTVRGGTIEVQGDLRDRVATLLQERGYRVKLVGG